MADITIGDTLTEEQLKGVDPRLQPLYEKQSDGSYALGDAGKIIRSKEGAKKDHAKAQEQLAALKAVVGERDPEDIKKLLAALDNNELERAKASGDVEKILANMEESHKKREQQWSEKESRYQAKLNNQTIKGAMENAREKADLTDEGKEVIPKLAMEFVKVEYEDESDDIRIVVLDDDHKSVRYDGAHPMTLDAFLKSFKSKYPSLYSDGLVSGTGGRAGGGKAAAPPHLAKPFDQMSGAEKATLKKKVGPEMYSTIMREAAQKHAREKLNKLVN